MTHTRTHLITEEEEHSSEVVSKYVSDLIKESVENAIITINEKEKIKMIKKGDEVEIKQKNFEVK